MSYRQRIKMQYRIAVPGELLAGRTFDIQEEPEGKVAVLLDGDHHSPRLARDITQLSRHQTVHGFWRQSWSEGGRMERPAEGLMMAVSRWERVPGRMLPSGRVVVVIEEDGHSVWLIDEDECTRRGQNDANDQLLRLAGDGLWLQYWFGRRRAPATARPAPLLTAPDTPLILA